MPSNLGTSDRFVVGRASQVMTRYELPAAVGIRTTVSRYL
jgi:hypothetical protein